MSEWHERMERTRWGDIIFDPTVPEDTMYLIRPEWIYHERIESMSDETRVVNEKTGGAKGSKLERFGLIPPEALRKLAEHYGKGERKYPTDENGVPNFRKGYDASLSFDALQRHAWQYWGGEDVDPETGTHHLIAVAWHALNIVQYTEDYGSEFDNRPNARLQRELDVRRRRYDDGS